MKRRGNKLKNLTQVLLAGLLVNLFLSTTLYSQIQIQPPENNTDDQRIIQLQRDIQRARLLENQGRIELAASLYQRLYNEHPGNKRIYDLYRDILIRMGNYEKAENIIQEFLDKNPNDVGSLVSLGTIYFNENNKDKAVRHWKAIIQTMGQNIRAYQLVLNTMIQHGLHNEASNLVENARENLNQPAFFSLQFGSYYASRLNYARATREYLLYYQHRGNNADFLVSQLSRFPDEEEVHDQVIPLLSQAWQENQDDPNLLRVLADYRYRIQNYDNAIQLYKRLEELEGNPGKYMRQLASDLLNDKEYTKAITVYTDLIKRTKTDSPQAELYLGAAEARYQKLLEQFNTSSPTGLFHQNIFWKTDFIIIPEETGPELTEIVEEFETVKSQFSETPYSYFAEYRLGEIFFKLGNDFDRAMEFFKEVTENQDHPMNKRASVNIGLCLLAKGDIQRARNHLQELENTLEDQTDLSNEVSLYIASTQFYEGNFIAGMNSLGDMVNKLDLTSEQFNDILEVQTFIENGLKKQTYADTLALQEYFRGEFFLKQHKISEAQNTFLHIKEVNGESPVIPYALIRIAQFSRMLNEHEEVESLLLRVINNYPDTKIIDHALFMLGAFYEARNNLSEAITWYEKILAEHPDSLLEQKARTAIRKLQRQTS